MKKGQKVFVSFPEYSLEDKDPKEAVRVFGTSFVVREGEILHERPCEYLVLFPKQDKPHYIAKYYVFEKKEDAQHDADVENAELLAKLAKKSDTQGDKIDRLEANIEEFDEALKKVEKCVEQLRKTFTILFILSVLAMVSATTNIVSVF